MTRRAEIRWYLERHLERLNAAAPSVDLDVYRMAVADVRSILAAPFPPSVAEFIDRLEHAISERAEIQARASRVLETVR